MNRTVDAVPNIGPRIIPLSTTIIFWSTIGIGEPTRGMAMKPLAAVNAANNAVNTMDFVKLFLMVRLRAKSIAEKAFH